MSYDQKHYEEIERRLDKKSKSMSSYMSNSKWRKLFNAVSPIIRAVAPWDADVQSKCFFKLIVEDFDRSGKWPEERDVLDTYIRDGVWGCPVQYRAIEWVLVPITYDINPNAKAVQNIKEIANVLNATGEFPLDETENSLKIWGYK